MVVSSFASVVVYLEFNPRPGLNKTLQLGSGTVTFLPGTQCTEELRGFSLSKHLKKYCSALYETCRGVLAA